jgi:hypothetical protein
MAYERIKFCDAYDIAHSIRLNIVENPDYDAFTDYFDPINIKVCQRFTKPHRWTLLHYCIDSWHQDYIDWLEERYNDMLDIVVEEYKTILTGYEIPYPTFEIPDEFDEDYDSKMNKTISSLRLLLPIKRIVNDTFQLLFGDREFLLNFNLIISRSIKMMKVSDYPEILVKDGMLKRVELPTWLKRGVFFRDRGRCIKCGKDLTGTIITGEDLHYDHIVSLADGGTNDPTNFQLLCKDCNLKKGKIEETSDWYPVYWKLEQ